MRGRAGHHEPPTTSTRIEAMLGAREFSVSGLRVVSWLGDCAWAIGRATCVSRCRAGDESVYQLRAEPHINGTISHSYTGFRRK